MDTRGDKKCRSSWAGSRSEKVRRERRRSRRAKAKRLAPPVRPWLEHAFPWRPWRSAGPDQHPPSLANLPLLPQLRVCDTGSNYRRVEVHPTVFYHPVGEGSKEVPHGQSGVGRWVPWLMWDCPYLHSSTNAFPFCPWAGGRRSGTREDSWTDNPSTRTRLLLRTLPPVDLRSPRVERIKSSIHCGRRTSHGSSGKRTSGLENNHLSPTGPSVLPSLCAVCVQRFPLQNNSYSCGIAFSVSGRSLSSPRAIVGIGERS